MRRIGTVLVVVLAVAGGVLPVVGVQAAAPTPSVEGGSTWGQTVTAGAENSSETAPGTRLAGSVGVQGAELGGELEERSFEHQVNRSNSNASKAQVVARQANQSQSRLAALRTQLRELEAAREDGRLSETEYRVRAAQLSARVTALERVTNRTTETARTLPAETLRQNGVNVTALETLRTEAGRLTGPEVAAIARSVAGPGAGRGNGPGTAANASSGNSDSPGPPEDAPGRSGAERADNASGSGGPPETPGESPGNETAAGSDQQRGGDAADGNGQGPPADGERGTDRTGNEGSGNGGGGGDAKRGGNSDEARERGGASDRSEPEETDTDRA